MSRSLLTKPPGSRPGCRPMRVDLSPASSTTASRQGATSLSAFTSASLPPQSPVAMSSLLTGPRQPALRLVVTDQSFLQRLAGERLQFGVERGAHRHAAVVELLLAVAVVEFAAHFLGEIFGREGVHAVRLLGDGERRGLGFLGVGGLDEAVLRHLVEHPIAPLDRALAGAERMVIVGRLGQRGEIGRFRDGQLVDALVEIRERRGGDAIGAKAQVDFVQVKLEDLVFAVSALDLERQQRLLDLAAEGNLVR